VKPVGRYDNPFPTADVNDIKTEAEQSFNPGFVFDIEANSKTCKDQSEANPAYSTP
jgi:hypothetical protein